MKPPRHLRALKERGVFEVVWPDGRRDELPFWAVRCACGCAFCVDELSGERLLNPDLIPRDVWPTQMSFSGNYALRITWSDGHSTGLLTWPRLRELAEAEA